MKSTLSERITLMMQALKLNQPELAHLAGVTKGAVNQWLSGLTKDIDAPPAFALQKKTGYSAEWIIFGSGPVKIAYTADPQAMHVLACMEKMHKQDKDQMVKISVALSEPAGHINNN